MGGGGETEGADQPPLRAAAAPPLIERLGAQPPGAGRRGRALASGIEPLGTLRPGAGSWGRARAAEIEPLGAPRLVAGRRGLVQAVETPSGSIAPAILLT